MQRFLGDEITSLPSFATCLAANYKFISRVRTTSTRLTIRNLQGPSPRHTRDHVSFAHAVDRRPCKTSVKLDTSNGVPCTDFDDGAVWSGAMFKYVEYRRKCTYSKYSGTYLYRCYADRDLTPEESRWKAISEAHQSTSPVTTTLKRELLPDATVPIFNAHLWGGPRHLQIPLFGWVPTGAIYVYNIVLSGSTDV